MLDAYIKAFIQLFEKYMTEILQDRSQNNRERIADEWVAAVEGFISVIDSIELPEDFKAQLLSFVDLSSESGLLQLSVLSNNYSPFAGEMALSSFKKKLNDNKARAFGRKAADALNAKGKKTTKKRPAGADKIPAAIYLDLMRQGIDPDTPENQALVRNQTQQSAPAPEPSTVAPQQEQQPPVNQPPTQTPESAVPPTPQTPPPSEPRPTENAKKELSKGRRLWLGFKNGAKVAAIGAGAGIYANATPWARQALNVIGGVGAGLKSVYEGLKGNELTTKGFSPYKPKEESKNSVEQSGNKADGLIPNEQIQQNVSEETQTETKRETEKSQNAIIELLKKIEENTRGGKNNQAGDSTSSNAPWYKKLANSISGRLPSLPGGKLAKFGMKAGAGALGYGMLSLARGNADLTEEVDPRETNHLGEAAGMAAMVSAIPGVGIPLALTAGVAAYAGRKVQAYQKDREEQNEKDLTNKAQSTVDLKKELENVSNSGEWNKLKDTLTGKVSEKGQLKAKIEKMIELGKTFTTEEVNVIKKKFGEEIEIPKNLIVGSSQQVTTKSSEDVSSNVSKSSEDVKIVAKSSTENSSKAISESIESLNKQEDTIEKNFTSRKREITEAIAASMPGASRKEVEKALLSNTEYRKLTEKYESDKASLQEKFNSYYENKKTNSTLAIEKVNQNSLVASELKTSNETVSTQEISEKLDKVADAVISTSNSSSNKNTTVNTKETTLIASGVSARSHDSTMLRWLDKRPVIA